MDKHVVYHQSNRIGKFGILDDVLADAGNRPWLQALFGLCVVIETARDESGRGQEYIAASDLFQELAEGEEIPKYRIDMTHTKFVRDEDEARRLDSGGFGFIATRQHILRVPALQVGARAHLVH